MNRRIFIITNTCAAVGVGISLIRDSLFSAGQEKKMLKAVIVRKPTKEDLLKSIKDAGFDGIEAGVMEPEEAAKARKTAEKIGLRIHSVIFGGGKFNDKKPEAVVKGIESVKNGILAAEAYGADALLLVPGRVKKCAMPSPWEFNIKFDPGTGHLLSVTDKENDKYKDYIREHDYAYDSCQKAIRELIPVAEKSGVIITVENVWNNMFVDPAHLAHFTDSFKSPWVQVYFDIGNHVKYSSPEKWIEILGSRIKRCHIKDFMLNSNGQGGKFVNIREGSVKWPIVRKALAQVGYKGWMTIEGSGKLSLEEKSKRLDLIIAGK